MNRLEHCSELVRDIRDCARRLNDLGFPGHAIDLYHAANETERLANERPSMPPVLASNLEARATASKHFQEARRLLRGIR